MYPHLNQVQLTGRLTKDPESVHMPSGMHKVTLSLAVNNRRKVGENYENKPAFITVECWGRTADSVADLARKGTPIFFSGQVTQDHWEKNGEKKNILKFNALSVMVLNEERPGSQQSHDPAPATGREGADNRPRFGADAKNNSETNDNNEEAFWNDDVPF